MNLRRTAVLALAVLLLGGFYYWYEVAGSKRRQAAEEQRQRLLAVKPGAVSAVTLRRGKMTLRATLRDGTWHLTSPLETRADQEAVGRLVEAAAQAKRLRLIEEEPTDLAAFSLAPPRLTIVLKTAEGTSTLAIGDVSPTGRGVYARAGSRGPVVLLEREAERAADKGLLAFRDKRLFDATAEEVTRLRITRGGEAMAVEKGADGAWALTEPLTAPADALAVEDLLEALTRGRAQRFIDDPEDDPSLYGLAAPRVTLTLTTRDGSTLGPLRLGKDAEAKEPAETATARLYARLGDTGPILLLEDSIIKAVPADATALRDRRLLVYEHDEVERLEAASAEETIVVERRGERAWAITKPLEVEADEGAVRNLLWDLKALRAKTFFDEADPEESRFGFGPSARRYVLHIKGRSETLQLEVGSEAKGGSERYVRVPGREGIVTVAAEEVSKITVTSLSLRDRRLIAFEPEAARRVEVTGPSRSLTVWKDGSVWQLTQPERRQLQTGRVTALLWALKRLKFSGVVEERRASEPTGEALLEARVWTGAATPQRVAVVRAPHQADGALLAVGSAKPGLYTVAEADLKEVEKEAERLLGSTE